MSNWINLLTIIGSGLLFVIIFSLAFFGKNNKRKSFWMIILVITIVIPSLWFLGKWFWQNTGWYGVGGLIALALLIAFSKSGTIKKTTPKTKPGAPAAIPSASKSTSTFKWGKLFKQIASLALLAGALFYGIQFWKEPTLVTSFFKGIFHRKELGLNKWFGVNAGEKYSVIVCRNTLGIWPTVKGNNDTVTVTIRNSEGKESYKTWNDPQGKRHEQRLTPSLDPTVGIFTFIFDKDIEVKLSTMPPE